MGKRWAVVTGGIERRRTLAAARARFAPTAGEPSGDRPGARNSLPEDRDRVPQPSEHLPEIGESISEPKTVLPGSMELDPGSTKNDPELEIDAFEARKCLAGFWVLLPEHWKVLRRSRNGGFESTEHLEEFSDNDSSFRDERSRFETSRATTKNALPESRNGLLEWRNVVDPLGKTISRNATEER